MQLFENHLEATFLRRPNRFVLYARSEEGTIRAHCPNPGRMRELLTPGRQLIFEKSNNPDRKTAFTLVAARYKGGIIPLFSGRANYTAAGLFLPEIYPGCTIRSEVRSGSSRFDFHASGPKTDEFIEVKACTLIEHGRAMFPDAPTLRGKRHVEELAEAGKGRVLFIAASNRANLFLPHVHTDPDFSLALLHASSKIAIQAVSINAYENGRTEAVWPELDVDLSPARLGEENTGMYLIMLELKDPCSIQVGKLGRIQFEPGYYIYAGSARKNLRQRVKRHLVKERKNKHWHIDYLTGAAHRITGFPVYSAHDLECPAAEQLCRISDSSTKGFGCSDCSCESHLFYFRSDPLENREFLELLLLLRHKWFLDEPR